MSGWIVIALAATLRAAAPGSSDPLSAGSKLAVAPPPSPAGCSSRPMILGATPTPFEETLKQRTLMVSNPRLRPRMLGCHATGHPSAAGAPASVDVECAPLPAHPPFTRFSVTLKDSLANPEEMERASTAILEQINLWVCQGVASPVRTGAPPPPATNPAPSRAPLLVKVEHTGCMGNCIAYTLTISQDGAVSYFGRRAVHLAGPHTGHLTPAALEQLRAAFAQAHFLDLDKSYNSYLDDAANMSMEYHDGDRSQLIRFVITKDAKRKRLLDLEAKVNAIVDLEQWIGRPGESRTAEGD